MTMDILDRGPVGMIGTACFGGALCLGTLVNATSAQPVQDFHIVTVIVSITGLVAAVASLIASFASLIRARDDEAPRRRRRR